MKLDIEINGQKKEAEFSYIDGKTQLTIDGKVFDAQVSQPEPGLFTIIINNKIYSTRAFRSGNSGNSEIIVNGKAISVSAQDKKSYQGKNGSGGGAGGKSVISAPMPGKIVRILLKEGDDVEAKQGVIIVEAMKMQNEVLSPKTGKVASIKVTEGQVINAGDVMVVIE